MTRRKSQFEPAIHRVRLDSLTIFEITEAELEALERGSQESLFLNLAITCLSIASSFLISLLTTTIPSDRTFMVFVVVCSIGFVSGITPGLLWWQARRSLKSVTATIRERMFAEGLPDNPTGQSTQ
ncbi:MAG: hypothetical protein KY476_05600 [Planctomycetes bacterium]|nr:hypothetical protein [Planctomycetota bacterium]